MIVSFNMNHLEEHFIIINEGISKNILCPIWHGIIKIPWYYKNTMVLDLKMSPPCQVLPKLTGVSEGRIWPTVIKSKHCIRV